MGDIKEMYHQIFVSPKDRDALRFIWRKFSTDPIKDYRMSVHIFCKIDSPCIAIWVVKKTAKGQTKSYSKRATESVLEHFYMYDFLDLFSSQAEAINICKEISKILKKGEFHLIKFISNDREILKSLPQDDLSANCQSVNLDLDKTPLERALRILWNPDKDTIKVRVVMKPFPLLKRGLLSFISSGFDPLRLLTPSMLETKLILQQPWKISLDWDEEIPPNLNNRWLKWLQITQTVWIFI